ncbi:MAG: hypothetical protein AAGC47_03865 [Bacteroidota bacterium]
MSTISNDTYLAVSVSVLVFALGFLATRSAKAYETWADKKRLRKYFKSQIRSVMNGFIPEAIKAYSSYSRSLNIEDGITLFPPLVLSNNFKRIGGVSFEKSFHSIKNKEALRRLLGSIDYAELLFPKIDEYHEKILPKSKEIRDELQKALIDYFDLLAETLKELRDLAPNSFALQNHFINLVNQYLLDYNQKFTGRGHLMDVYSKVIRPLQMHIINSGVYNDYPGFQTISGEGKRIALLISSLDGLMKDVKSQYNKFSEELNNNLRTLEQAFKEIDWD